MVVEMMGLGVVIGVFGAIQQHKDKTKKAKLHHDREVRKAETEIMQHAELLERHEARLAGMTDEQKLGYAKKLRRAA